MRVCDLRLDCDGDAILYIVDANGPSCHTNATSCFFRSVTPSGLVADDGPAPVAAKWRRGGRDARKSRRPDPATRRPINCTA